MFDNRSMAVFAHSTYQWTDRITTTHAVRFTRDAQDRVRDSSDFTLFPRTSVLSYTDYSTHADITGAALVGYSDDAKWNETTWRLAVDYAATGDMLWYASVSRGYKAGLLGGLCDAVLGRFPVVEPETVLAWEIGVKSRWFDDRLQVNAAVFFYDYEHYQSYAQLIDENLNVKTIDINIPQVDLKGFEVEVLAQPTENLTFSLGYGAVRNEIKKFVDLASHDLTGNDVANSPRQDITGYLRYDMALPGGGALSPQVDWFHTGKYYNANENFARFGGFWTYNARLIYRTGRLGISVQAFVENIGDEREQLAGSPEYIGALGSDYRVTSLPRTWGITLRTDF